MIKVYYPAVLSMLCEADFVHGVFHKVAGQGEDEKKLRPWLHGLSQLWKQPSWLWKIWMPKFNNTSFTFMVTSGTPHEPKSISSNCQQPTHTVGALCGFPNCNTKFSSQDSFGHECFQHQTYRRQHLWLKFFDLGLGMKIYKSIRMHAIAMMIFVILLIGVILAAAAFLQDGSARFLWVLPGWHCSLGPQMSLWWVRHQEDFKCGKVVVYAMYTGDLLCTSFLRNQIQVAVANIIEDRPSQ